MSTFNLASSIFRFFVADSYSKLYVFFEDLERLIGQLFFRNLLYPVFKRFFQLPLETVLKSCEIVLRCQLTANKLSFFVISLWQRNCAYQVERALFPPRFLNFVTSPQVWQLRSTHASLFCVWAVFHSFGKIKLIFRVIFH